MFDETPSFKMNDQLLLDVRLLSMRLRKLLISDMLETGLKLTAPKMSFWAGLICVIP